MDPCPGTLTKTRFLAIVREAGLPFIEAEQCWPRIQRVLLEGKVELLARVRPALHGEAFNEYDTQMEAIVRKVMFEIAARRAN